VINTLESRSSHAVALSLSALNARLNDLQEGANELRTQREQILDSHGDSTDDFTADRSVLAITNDYGVPHESQDLYRHVPLYASYERALHRYQHRLMRARHEIQRLESDGLQLTGQRRRLNRLSADFYTSYRPALDGGDVPGSIFDISRTRDDSEPVPQILSVPERFTSSPQPMAVEMMSSGAVRAASTSSSSANSSNGPEMELPPLRRMRYRPHVIESRPWYRQTFAEDLPDELHDGLGDRDRSLEPDMDGPSPQAEEENWSTMLSTIAPDDRLPSASSSFASDAASRSFSGGGAGSSTSSRAPSSFSAGTTITVPDDGGCDTEEVWRVIGDRLGRGEEVPDEQWVNAGVPANTARLLARSMRERL
jgi:hypothetical protein